MTIKQHINSSKLTFFSDDESYLDDNSNGPDGPDSMIPQASKVDIEKKGKKKHKYIIQCDYCERKKSSNRSRKMNLVSFFQNNLK